MFQRLSSNTSGSIRPTASIPHATSSDGNAPSTIRLLATIDQLNMGIRSIDMPAVRLSSAVHSTVAPMSSSPVALSATPAIHSDTPGPGV